MALIVEDGTGLPDADSYVAVSEFETYAENYNIDISSYSDESIEAAARKATQYIDRTYEGRWPGTKVNGRDQALSWPRENAYDQTGELIADDEVPDEVIEATLECWAKELTTPNTLTPVVSTNSGQVIRETVGPISREFANTGSTTTTTRAVLPSVDDLLKNIVGNSGSVGFLRRA